MSLNSFTREKKMNHNYYCETIHNEVLKFISRIHLAEDNGTCKFGQNDFNESLVYQPDLCLY